MANEKRLIDANALLKKAIWGKIHQGMVYESDAKVVTTGAIATAPTVDAVEVVRCKDCKYRYYNEDNEAYCCEAWGDGYDTMVNQDEFCSRGERKGNGI